MPGCVREDELTCKINRGCWEGAILNVNWGCDVLIWQFEVEM